MNQQNPHVVFDKEQFEMLFKTHFSHLTNFANQFVQDPDASQEIVQKVFITLWEKREHVDPQLSIKSYLFTSVRNRCLNYLRDQKKYKSKVLDLECAEFELATEEPFSDLDGLKKQLEAALERLPDKCREVFEMSRFRQMKYKEIAEELEISQKTVEAHMRKAMQVMREVLKSFSWVFILLWGKW